MKQFICVLIALIPFVGYCQDSIFLKDGAEISAKILKVKSDEVDYKKPSNLDGPVYSIEKNKILLIKYQNGETDVFNSDKTVSTSNIDSQDSSESLVVDRDSDLVLKQLSKQNNIVYVECEDEGAKIHATRELKAWGFWRVAPDKDDADLILKFVGRYNGPGNWSTYVQFVNPMNGQILKTSTEHSDFWGWDINPKRGATKKLIEKEIINVFY